MASKSLSRDQFVISVRGITHLPTGATFTPHAGSPFSGPLNNFPARPREMIGDRVDVEE